MTIEEAARDLIAKTPGGWVNSREVTEHMGLKGTVTEVTATAHELRRLLDEGVLDRKRMQYGFIYTLSGGGNDEQRANIPHSVVRGGITLAEMKRARERCQIGDVLPAEVYGPSETVDTVQKVRKDVVVDYKSTHLIHCTDGSTFSYAALAMYYRCGRPLGRWDR